MRLSIAYLLDESLSRQGGNALLRALTNVAPARNWLLRLCRAGYNVLMTDLEFDTLAESEAFLRASPEMSFAGLKLVVRKELR